MIVFLLTDLGGFFMKRGDERTQEIDAVIGQRVRALRKLKGLNQNDFAKMIGVTFQQLQKYELATNRISCSRLVVMAEALGVDVSEFFYNITKSADKNLYSDEEVKLIAKLRKLPRSVSKNIFALADEL